MFIDPTKVLGPLWKKVSKGKKMERLSGCEGQLMMEWKRSGIRGSRWRNGEPEGKAAAVRDWM